MFEHKRASKEWRREGETLAEWFGEKRWFKDVV